MNRDTLVEYLRDKLGVDTSDLQDETLLFSSSMIDSFSMVDLIVFLETTANFKMKPTQVNLDNLDSVSRILAFVDSQQGDSAS